MLRPASKQEHQISSLWWVMLAGAAIGFGVIAVLLFLGWWRRNRADLPGGGGEKAATALVIGLGIVVPVIVLSGFFVWADIFVLKRTDAPSPSKTAMTIQVIGHQWWWEVRYPGTKAVTANEIHIPVRTPVNLVVTTDDVIHSFWVPALNRKIDMIPGRRNTILLDASRVGRYRGQCAEFCGLQHAHMSMSVYADPPERFRSWLANMAAPAQRPGTALARQGTRAFQTLSCAGCHTIRGTAADGRVGPDLTHLQTRRTLAALTIPESKLGEWISDPQHAKPGNKMPGIGMSQADHQALLSYLESLK